MVDPTTGYTGFFLYTSSEGFTECGICIPYCLYLFCTGDRWKAENFEDRYYYPTGRIGRGGNINKLFRLADKKDKKQLFLPLASLQDIYRTLKDLPKEQRIKLFKLKPDRADVIVPAAEIFMEVATRVQANGIIVPTIGLSDGIIDSLYTKNRQWMQ